MSGCPRLGLGRRKGQIYAFGIVGRAATTVEFNVVEMAMVMVRGKCAIAPRRRESRRAHDAATSRRGGSDLRACVASNCVWGRDYLRGRTSQLGESCGEVARGDGLPMRGHEKATSQAFLLKVAIKWS